MHHIRQSVHEPFLSIHQVYLIYYTSKKVSSLPEVHIMALSGAHEIAHFLQVVT